MVFCDFPIFIASRNGIFHPLVLFVFAQICATQPDFIYHYCINDKGNFTSNSTYKTNLDHVLSSIINTNETSNGFFNFSYGQSSDLANAMGLCRGDVKPEVCRNCLNDSIYLLTQHCPQQKEVIVWYDNCTLRYSNRYLLGSVETDPSSSLWVTDDAANGDLFNQKLITLLDSLKTKASSGGSSQKYATGDISGEGFETIYALVQCTPDLSQLQCNECLDSAFIVIQPCCSQGYRVFLPSCNMRYELYQFFEPSVDSPPPLLLPSPSPLFTPSTDTTGKKNKKVQIVIVIAPLFVALLVFTISIHVFMRSRKLMERLDTDDDISVMESLQYDFNVIKDATDHFSDANKLGQGGFGIVYKGRFFDGQEVAVKRLVQGSEQGDSEFKNEVLLVAKLQHRNLVKLVGFCLERNERLLVYEFLLNSSLDRFIFDPTRRRYLDWIRRYKIIVGITRGLLYLHEDSQLRVVHRDLKASNILLDGELNPKITDFGLAKLFSIDQSQANTSKIMGTYGYMAPEYALHGHFSVKSDVFSFGVLLLEIVSGQKNGSFRDGENIEHLLSYTWKNWTEGTVTNIIDPTLGRTSIDEILRCIHLGLLCVQENVASRPIMASVVLMLSSNSLTLPVPSRPGFLLQSNTINMPQHLDSEKWTHYSRSESTYIEESMSQPSINNLHSQ